METAMISPLWGMFIGFITAIFIIAMIITDNGEVVWMLIFGAILGWIIYLVINWILPGLFPGIGYYIGILADLISTGCRYLAAVIINLIS